MKQVKTIQFSTRIVNGYPDALATVTCTDGTVEHLRDQDAMAALMTFAVGYALPALDDARDVVKRAAELTGKPLPEWITP